MEEYIDKMLSNNDILDRVDLYKSLEKSVFSPKRYLNI